MLWFALDGPDPLPEALARALEVAAAPHEDRAFEDGEHKVRALVDPRGEDCYVLAGLHGGPDGTPGASPHDRLVRLWLFVGALREHGAARVTAVVPYLAYARKDQQTKPYDPVSLRYVAQLFEAVGTAQLIVLEAHNVAALQNAFRCTTMHLDCHPIFDAVAERWAARGAIAIASPDPGGVKRALRWREHLQARLPAPVGFAMIDKRRSAGIVSGEGLVAGDVKGTTALVFDDLVASGETMRRAALALRKAGAREVVAVAAHGLFIGPAAEVLADPVIAEVAVSDSVPAFRLPADAAVRGKLRVVSAAGLFAAAIRRSAATWGR